MNSHIKATSSAPILSSLDLAALDSIQAEFDELQGAPESSNTSHKNVVMGSSTGNDTQISLVGCPPGVNQPPMSLDGHGALPTAAPGKQIVVPQTTSVTVSVPAPKTVQTIVKRPGVSTSGQLVTKVIITKNPNTNQPQAVPVSVHANQSTLFATSVPQVLTAVSAGSLTPTKTITLSQTGILSPTKGIVSLTGTPVKQQGTSKIAISPVKTPTKITMIPVTISKSPQKIVPFPAGQNVFAMVAKTPTSTVTSSQAKPATITMSPSKVIIKQHPQAGAAGKAITIPNAGPNVQQIQVPGSRFHYVRLVSSTQPQATPTVKPASIAPTPIQAKPIAPMSMSSAPQVKIAMPVNHSQVAPKVITGGNQAQTQRILLPATSQGMTQITPNLAPATISQLPAGTTFIQPNQAVQGVQGYALVPAQYITQLQQQLSQAQQPAQRQEPAYVPISTLNTGEITASAVSNTSTKQPVSGTLLSEPTGQRPRKPCNCTKSQCLKLYCDCFANGEFCHNCNCANCANNLDHEDERSRAIKACLDRNPMAFHPKIGKGRGGDRDRRHQKGCNCKRSGCLKNYCECYEAKILCSTMCKCVGCKNFEESPERKTLMHLADAAEVRVQQQTAARTKLSSQIQDLPSRPPLPTTGERLPYTFVTSEVADATCSCLLAVAEEGERLRHYETNQERRILEEFGRCLMSVIESANRTKVSSPAP